MTEPAQPGWTLDAEERRVLGVLIEKGLATPEYYPMAQKALLAGCNQRSNRDPITHLEESRLDDVLERLKERGLVTSVLPSTGRVEGWRQDLGKRLELRGVELAILGELFLRGPQSEGELRSRASRMRPIAGMDELRELLGGLRGRRLVRRLTPEGVQRGVRWAHGFYPAGEKPAGEADRAPERPSPGPAGSPNRPSGPTLQSAPTSQSDLARRVAALESRVAELERRLRAPPA